VKHVLAVRLDSAGDVLVTGPAIRALARDADRVTLLCGPQGRSAAELLPGVDELLCFRAPWIDPEPEGVDRAGVLGLVDTLAGRGIDGAFVFVSFHQSALPTALLLRLAGVPWIGAISEDYPGSLLDLRHHDPGDVHEVERALSLVEAAGYRLPRGDDGCLRVTVDEPDERGGYVVVHPGASVPAREWPAERYAELVRELTTRGRRVVVSGAPGERKVTALVAGAEATDLGGRTTLRELARILAGADAVVVGNTGPAHLAAAVGTPVVSLFAPVVPAARWRPWGVPHVLLGDQDAACRGTRARECPVPGHPCLASVQAEDVLAALDSLIAVEVAA
jgi:ADP-heptose:LPS heptosyltransferase